MPTAAWTGFLHSWHTLGIVLKWMCITVVGIPAAIATCVLIALAVLLFGALCLGAVAAALAGGFYLLRGVWWMVMRIPWWVTDWRIRRAERLLVGTLPITEDRSRAGRWLASGVGRQVSTEMTMGGHRHSITLTTPCRVYLTDPVTEEPAAPIEALPGMIECLVCMEPKWPVEYPHRPPTDDCNHEATECCTACLAQCVESAFEGNVWDDIRCPSCNLHLEHKDVAEFAPLHIFQRYDTLSTRRTIEATIPSFSWCIGPSCSFGQETIDNPKKEPIVTCSSCGLVQCSHHQVKWHDGMTCDEYDIHTAAGAAVANKKSEKIIKRIAKKCPGCQRFINKNGGCPHMTCRCGRQWCWSCGHDYPGHTWGCTRRS